jgi:hypothetical protein
MGGRPVSRELRTFQPLEGPAGALTAAFTSDPSEWLPTTSTDDTGARKGGGAVGRGDGARAGEGGEDAAEEVAYADGTWTFSVHAGSLARRVRATIGRPWHVTRTSWRSVSWEPVTVNDEQASVNRMLPPLDGELGIHVDESGRATLVLDARYVPPGGLLGAAVDAVALHRLARQTGQRFLEDVGAGLNRVASERTAPEHPSPSSDD